MKIKKQIVALVASAVMVSGCATMEEQFPQMKGRSKEMGGALLGAVAGGLLGSQVGSGKGRTLAILLGTAGGAWLGAKIGAQLDEADRIALQNESAKALSSANDGQPVQWASAESGAHATMTPQNSRTEKREITVLRDKRVEPAPQLELIGEQYEAIKSANVRSAPSTDGERVGGLRAGEPFTAVGKVVGNNWIMVAKNKVSVGYVYAPLVKPSTQEAPAELRQAINLDDVNTAESTQMTGIDLDGVPLDVEVVAESVAVETDCRTMKYEVTGKDGKTEQDQFDACRGADGAWEIG